MFDISTADIISNLVSARVSATPERSAGQWVSVGSINISHPDRLE
jgi:hypothetical protein